MVFKALRNIVPNFGKGVNEDRKSVIPQRKNNAGFGGVAILDPSNLNGMKSMDVFSRNALDFVNSGSTSGSSPYSEDQLLGAYLSSVYLYAAIRRVSNLMSRVKVVAEVMDGGKWVRLPETHKLNLLFANEGRELLPRIWLNHAIYGVSAVYKVKSRRAILEAEANRPIYDYKDGAVSGLYVLDKPMWDVDEDSSYGRIKGFYVSQYDPSNEYIGNRTYIEREEVIYVTDWNPKNPNRGKSLAAVCIHEAVANASIAQWMAEYFTRGAMPLIMVSMSEDDPTMMSDSDLRKYKRQFEEYWSGMSSSLRSVFVDRKVDVQQIGINANDVAAPDLNQAALEGIAAVIGLDRELIVTPEGGSQERHALLIKRAWEDSVIPRVEVYLASINRDLGLPANYRLVADLSDIAELEADRENKSSTEVSIYESGIQAFNEVRTRLNMPPIKGLDGFFNYDGKPTPIEQILRLSKLPPERMMDYALQLWDNNLAKRSEVLELVGRPIPEGLIDGYRYEIESRDDMIDGAWADDLLTRSQILALRGWEKPARIEWEDGYRSELEKGKDYGDWITGLFDNDLLTRSQTIELLNMGIKIPSNFVDGYSTEIREHHGLVTGYWGDSLLTRRQAMEKLGIPIPAEGFTDGYINQVEKLDEYIAGLQTVEPKELYSDQLITKGEALKMLGITPPYKFVDGYESEVSAITDALVNKKVELITNPPEQDEQNTGNNLNQFQTSETGSRLFDNTGDDAKSMTDEYVTKAAEEDLLQDYGDYDWISLGDNYGDMIDIYPSSALPTVDDNTEMGEYTPKNRYENSAVATDSDSESDDEVTLDAVTKILHFSDAKQKSVQRNAYQELTAWQRATNKGGSKKAIKFENIHIPYDIANIIRSRIEDSETLDKNIINRIFSDAKTEIIKRGKK